MGKKINVVEEMKEIGNFEKILKDNIVFTGNEGIFMNYVVGTDSLYRTSNFVSFSKAKLQRCLEYLDRMVMDTVHNFEKHFIEEEEYKTAMFLHCSMAMSILDSCKTWGWTVSKNWVIK